MDSSDDSVEHQKSFRKVTRKKITPQSYASPNPKTIRKENVKFVDEVRNPKCMPQTPHPKKGILKHRSMENLTVIENEDVIKKKVLKQKIPGTPPKPSVEWRILRKYLLEAHYGDMSPSSLINQLKELWSEEDQRFVCPFPSCLSTYRHRLHCLNHVLCRHLVEHNNVHVKPFFCQSCCTSFRSVDDLMEHGEKKHSRCNWLPKLREIVQKCSV